MVVSLKIAAGIVLIGAALFYLNTLEPLDLLLHFVTKSDFVSFSRRRYNDGNKCESTVRIDGQVIVITGANTGLGKTSAEELALRGGKIYMGCRSIERGTKAADDILNKHPSLNQNNLIVLKLDLGSTKSIREFVADFKEREERLDVLMNNAGVLWLPEGSRTEDGFESTFGINHLGHFLLTHLLMERILAAAPSRVVTVSSDGHRAGSLKLEDPMLTGDYSPVAAYTQSKLANVLFSSELGRRLQGTGVTTYCAHPGAIPTDMGRNFPVIGHPSIYPHIQYIASFLMKGLEAGVQTQICCALDATITNHTGKYYADCREVEAAPFDKDLPERLWNLSVELLKLTDGEIHEKLL